MRLALSAGCYVCGATYEVTSDATRFHSHHAGTIRYREAMAEQRLPPAARTTVNKLLSWLEACQRERDDALVLVGESAREAQRLAELYRSVVKSVEESATDSLG